MPQTISNSLYAEQIRLLYHSSLAGPLLQILVASLALFIIWDRVDHLTALLWLAGLALMAVLRIVAMRAYQKVAPPPQQAKYWAWLAITLYGINGLMWGLTASLFFAGLSHAYQLILTVILVGISANIMIIAAQYIPVYIGFVVCSLALHLFGYLTQVSTFGHVVALLLGLFIVHTITVARVLNRHFVEMIRLRFELAAQKELAERANTAKSKFLASASHDLRQPLHALTLFSGGLTKYVQAPEGLGIIENIQLSARALQNLLNSLLDISKLDSGVVQTDIRHFSLAPVFEQLENEFAAQATAKGLALKLDRHAAVVVTDPVLLGNILRNLISNAIRYTNAGQVSVDCTADTEQVRIVVADTGIGIPADQQQQVFREFYQLNNPGRDRQKGMGLGLSIVERLCEMLDIELKMDSFVGKGTSFTLGVRAGDPTRVLHRPDPTDSNAQDDLPSLRVLVIDDEPTILDAMQVLLNGWGHSTMVARDEAEATKNIRQSAQRPDLIISDYRLQGTQNGLELIESLQNQFGLDVPVLIVSGDIDQDSLQHIQQSAHPSLQKPLDPARLRAFLRRIQRKKIKPA